LGGEHYDSKYFNAPQTSFEVKTSGVADNAGRGVFAKVDILEGTYFSAETICHPVLFTPSTVALIEALDDEEPIGYELEPLVYYISGYGFTSRHFVSFAILCHFHFFLSDKLTMFVVCVLSGSYLVGRSRSLCGFRLANICQSWLQG
jgi:hypothetical protein